MSWIETILGRLTYIYIYLFSPACSLSCPVLCWNIYAFSIEENHCTAKPCSQPQRHSYALQKWPLHSSVAPKGWEGSGPKILPHSQIRLQEINVHLFSPACSLSCPVLCWNIYAFSIEENHCTAKPCSQPQRHSYALQKWPLHSNPTVLHCKEKLRQSTGQEKSEKNSIRARLYESKLWTKIVAPTSWR